MEIIFGILGGIAVTTIFFLIRELRIKNQISEMWKEIEEFEVRMIDEIEYIQDTIQNESKEQWDDIHEQWNNLNEFEDRLIEVLDDELDDDKVNYIKNNKTNKKVDDSVKLDEILAKISKSGMDSLTPEELKFLKKNK